MPNNLVFIAAPDHHIDFMKENPDTILDYGSDISILERCLRYLGLTRSLPEDWPVKKGHRLGLEVNHRNCDLYHELLNGTNQPVSHSGAIFQTWLGWGGDNIIDLSLDDFALKSQHIPELLNIVSNITKIQLRERFASWLYSVGGDTKAAENYDYHYEEFQEFRQYLQIIVDKKHGLIWIAS